MGVAPPPTRQGELGRLVLHHLRLIPTGHPELRLTRFPPADERTRRALMSDAA